MTTKKEIVLQDLNLQAKTEITENNLPDFAKQFRQLLATVNTDLKTDEDFVTAKDLIKKFDLSEKALKAAKEKIFESGGLAEINNLINELSAESRQIRLNLNKTVTQKLASVKKELIENARKIIVQASEKSPMHYYSTIDWSDIELEIKGKSSLEKMKESLDIYVGVKVNAIQTEETALMTKEKLIKALIKGNEHMFHLQSLMQDDAYEATIENRIEENNEAIRKQALIEAEALETKRKQADAKAKADALALDAANKAQVKRNDTVEPVPAQDNQKQMPSATSVDGSVEYHNQAVKPVTFRIRIDLSCEQTDAVLIANGIKNNYDVVDVSLNKVELN